MNIRQLNKILPSYVVTKEKEKGTYSFIKQDVYLGKIVFNNNVIIEIQLEERNNYTETLIDFLMSERLFSEDVSGWIGFSKVLNRKSLRTLCNTEEEESEEEKEKEAAKLTRQIKRIKERIEAEKVKLARVKEANYPELVKTHEEEIQRLTNRMNEKKEILESLSHSPKLVEEKTEVEKNCEDLNKYVESKEQLMDEIEGFNVCNPGQKPVVNAKHNVVKLFHELRFERLSKDNDEKINNKIKEIIEAYLKLQHEYNEYINNKEEEAAKTREQKIKDVLNKAGLNHFNVHKIYEDEYTIVYYNDRSPKFKISFDENGMFNVWVRETTTEEEAKRFLTVLDKHHNIEFVKVWIAEDTYKTYRGTTLVLWLRNKLVEEKKEEIEEVKDNNKKEKNKMKIKENNIQEFINKAGLNLTAHKIKDFLITVVDNDRNGMFKVWLDNKKQLIETIWIEPTTTQEDGKRFIKEINKSLMSEEVELRIWQDGNTYTEFKSLGKIMSWLGNLNTPTLKDGYLNLEDFEVCHNDSNFYMISNDKDEAYMLYMQHPQDLRKDFIKMHVVNQSMEAMIDHVRRGITQTVLAEGKAVRLFMGKYMAQLAKQKQEAEKKEQEFKEAYEETFAVIVPSRTEELNKEEQDYDEYVMESIDQQIEEATERAKGYDKNERASRVIKVVTGKDVNAAEMTFGDFLNMMEETEEEEEIQEEATPHTLEAQLERVKIAFLREENKRTVEKLQAQVEDFENVSKWHDEQATIERREKNNRAVQQCKSLSSCYKEKAKQKQKEIQEANDILDYRMNYLVDTDEIPF